MVVLNSVTVDNEMMKNWDPEVSNHILFWWKLLRTVGNVWRQKLSQNFLWSAVHTSCPLGGFWANVMPFWLDKALFDREKNLKHTGFTTLGATPLKNCPFRYSRSCKLSKCKIIHFLGSLIFGKLIFKLLGHYIH